MEADFPKLERHILERWKQEQAFEKSLQKRKKGKRFVFYEGPPTANGSPGIHHVLSRSFKDVVCRYKTMRGFFVPRKAGWDTHGLPVELQIEKKLGLRSKKDIEQYGIAKFNKACKQSVWEYKQEWDTVTARIGFWLDTRDPYITYSRKYMEQLWQVVQAFWKKELLYKDYKVVPYCPRCGTAVSSHEVAQGYKTTKDRSVYVKFQISNFKFPTKSQIPHAKLYMLAWTTTPWTLPGNVALAVGKKIVYTFVEQNGEVYIVAKNLLEKLEGEYTVLQELSGKELEGVEYVPLFDSLKEEKEKKHYVVSADFVTTEDGTGIVHTAVMYGEDDYQLGAKVGLPKKHTVDQEGKFNELVYQWKGVFVKDAEPSIIENLQKRNLLYKEELYEHEYPFCWRCSTPLLYYAKDSWFVDMQKVKKELLANNQSVHWIPPHIKTGRMGEWLQDVKDWAFSRERYWGTPLPIWECGSCAHREVIGSVEEIKKKTTPKNVYYVLRHGHSDRQVTNANASWPEQSPVALTTKGKKQIAKQAKAAKRKRISVIVSSDLLRAKQTAAMVGKELDIPVVYDKRLREFDTGLYNGKTVEEMIEAVWKVEGETPLEHFLRRFTVSVPKGENWVEVERRVRDLMEYLEKTYSRERIVLVSHEVPITLLQGVMDGLSREETVRFRIKHAIGTGEMREIRYTALPYNKDMEVDLHRPYIDEIEFTCTVCEGGILKRVKDVADVWFDSGAMPFASGVNEYPADYIVEAIDQTRGWFYTLLAVATLLGKKAPYKNVISLGHVLDENGEKMSKSKGNIVDPWSMLDKYGADTIRWYFYTMNHPWDSKAFAERDVQQTMRKFMLTLWNSFVFYKTYGEKVKSKKLKGKTENRNSNILDQWIVSRLHSTAKEVTKGMDAYDITGAARAMEGFVIDDLSLWYIRRSRQRFQNPGTKRELQEASNTLQYVLSEVSTLTAPFAPFISEYIFGEMGNKESVHWQDWPRTSAKQIHTKLEQEMRQARDIVTKALAERAKAGIKVRQPLASLKIQDTRLAGGQAKYKIQKELLELVKDEVNVKEVVYDKNIQKEIELDITITPVLKREGMIREIVRHIQNMRKQAGYKPKDRVRLRYSGAEELKEILLEHKKEITVQVGLAEMLEGDLSKQRFDVEQEFSLGGQVLWLAICKL